MSQTIELRSTGLVCGECGAIRMRGRIGMVCPNGHGRIYPPEPKWKVKRAHRDRWALSLPRAHKVKGGWSLEGHPGIWRMVKFDPEAAQPFRVPTKARIPRGKLLACMIKKNINVRVMERIK